MLNPPSQPCADRRACGRGLRAGAIARPGHTFQKRQKDVRTANKAGPRDPRACPQNRTRARSRKRARTGTLDGPDRGGNMAHPRAADDFQAIRARMEELRRERERAAVKDTNRGSIQPARRDNGDPMVVWLRRIRSQIELPLVTPPDSSRHSPTCSDRCC